MALYITDVGDVDGGLVCRSFVMILCGLSSNLALGLMLGFGKMLVVYIEVFVGIEVVERTC